MQVGNKLLLLTQLKFKPLSQSSHLLFLSFSLIPSSSPLPLWLSLPLYIHYPYSVRRELVSQLAMNNRQLLLFSDDEEDEVEECDDELTAFDGSLKDSLNPEVSRIEMTQKQTSKTSSILWISLTLYLAISLPLIVAMVALAAVQVWDYPHPPSTTTHQPLLVVVKSL